jgi:hypothetical protein
MAIVHSVAASMGENQSALVSWLWGANVEMSGRVRDLRYSTHTHGTWSAPVSRQVYGRPPWRPALMSAGDLGSSTLASGADTEVATLRGGSDGKCSPGSALPSESSPGNMPILASGANQEVVALLTAPSLVTVSLSRLQRGEGSWDPPIQTDLPAGVSFTAHAEASALATWRVSQPTSIECRGQLLGNQYRRDAGLGESFMIQPAANGVLRHDAVSAPSGVALVA